jgi:plasmid stabilization system protein ParE
MTFEIIILPRAQAEIEKICSWLTQWSAAAAARWHGRIGDAIRSLENHPERCALAPESLNFKEEIRQLLFGKKANIYRILFVVEERRVVVLSVRHGSREILKPD